MITILHWVEMRKMKNVKEIIGWKVNLKESKLTKENKGLGSFPNRGKP